MPKFDVAATFASHKLSELEDIAAELQTIIAAKQQEERAKLTAQLAEIAKRKGFTLEDLLPRPARKQSVVRPKYRGAAGQTWSGRGRAPKWMPDDTKQWDKLLIPEAERNAVAAALN